MIPLPAGSASPTSSGKLFYLPQSWWPHPAELRFAGKGGGRERRNTAQSWDLQSVSPSEAQAETDKQLRGGTELTLLLPAQLVPVLKEDCLNLFSQVPVALPC